MLLLESPCKIADQPLMQHAVLQVEEYERRAVLLSDYEAERRKLAILSQLSSSSSYAPPSMQLRDMGLYIVELKQYLQVR